MLKKKTPYREHTKPTSPKKQTPDPTPAPSVLTGLVFIKATAPTIKQTPRSEEKAEGEEEGLPHHEAEKAPNTIVKGDNEARSTYAASGREGDSPCKRQKKDQKEEDNEDAQIVACFKHHKSDEYLIEWQRKGPNRQHQLKLRKEAQ